MDAYEAHLMRMAVEAMGGLTITSGFDPGVVRVEDTSGHGLRRGEGPTLAEALAALLRDLDVEVPERPSAERVREVKFELHAAAVGALGVLHEEYARDRLAVIALLEGDAA